MTKNSSGFCAKYPEIKFKEIYWKETDISVRINFIIYQRV